MKSRSRLLGWLELWSLDPAHGIKVPRTGAEIQISLGFDGREATVAGCYTADEIEQARPVPLWPPGWFRCRRIGDRQPGSGRLAPDPTDVAHRHAHQLGDLLLRHARREQELDITTSPTAYTDSSCPGEPERSLPAREDWEVWAL